MGTIRIDPSAHKILKGVRTDMKLCGIDGATLSDAVRRLGENYSKNVSDRIDK